METYTATTVTYIQQPPPQYVVQPQVFTPVPVAQVITVRQNTYGVEKSVGLGVAEIILRVICLVRYYQ